MCGLTGIINFSGVDQSDTIRIMNDSIHHRGPDEDGYYISDRVLLGHKRLSIIDVKSGHQPMKTSNEEYIIVYNGEVYNFPLIRNELQALGVEFKTHCDTEVILEAYKAWGIESVNKLRGMFAFAVYDTKQNKVFLVRDRLGIKPLFYATTNKNDVIFASELKAVTCHSDFSKAFRNEGLEEYLSLGYIPEPNSIYKNALKLQPGYWLEIDLSNGHQKQHQYWDLEFEQTLKMSEEEAVDEFNRRFKEAIDIRLVAEVPLGAFLSGGVDSSAVVATMSSLTDKPVNTCSIGFDVKAYDESDYADAIAARYKTNHLKKTIGSDEFQLIDKLVDIYDEPYADSSALPTFRVCELAKQQVTVALSGDGADEMLAGYRRYKFQHAEDKLRGMLPPTARRLLFSPLGNIYPKMDWAPRIFRAKSTFQSLAKDSVNGYFQSVSIVNDDMRNKLFSQTYRSDTQNYYAGDVFQNISESAKTDCPLAKIQLIDIKSYLLGDILTKVDRASMANSLEVRVPFLDHKLVEWMAKLPTSLKLKNGTGKYLLKKSMESKLPHDLMYRQKMGFRVPLAEWFRGPLRTQVETLSSGVLADSGLFNVSQIQHMITNHTQGISDYSSPLWTLFMLEKFMMKNG